MNVYSVYSMARKKMETCGSKLGDQLAPLLPGKSPSYDDVPIKRPFISGFPQQK